MGDLEFKAGGALQRSRVVGIEFDRTPAKVAGLPKTVGSRAHCRQVDHLPVHVHRTGFFRAPRTMNVRLEQLLFQLTADLPILAVQSRHFLERADCESLRL
jgi:hypothetical protein